MPNELCNTERGWLCKGCKGLMHLHFLSVTTVLLTNACAASVLQEKPCFHSQCTPPSTPPPPPHPGPPSPLYTLRSFRLPLAFPQIDAQAWFITIHQVSLRHASLLSSLQLCRARRGRGGQGGGEGGKSKKHLMIEKNKSPLRFLCPDVCTNIHYQTAARMSCSLSLAEKSSGEQKLV